MKALNFYTRWRNEIEDDFRDGDGVVAIAAIIAGTVTAVIWMLTFLTITAIFFWILLIVSLVEAVA